MVRAAFVWAYLVLFVSFGCPKGQTEFQEPAELPQRVAMLYQLRFDEDFFLVAESAGTILWEDYAGPFPNKDVWGHTLRTMLIGNEKATHIVAAEGTDLFAEAEARHIPVYIDIYVSGDTKTKTVQVRYTFQGIFSKTLRFENVFEANIPLEEDLRSYFWIPLNTDLADFLTRIIRPPLRIEGPAGTAVYGFSKKPLLIPETEYILIDVPLPGTYSWRMVCKGYWNRRGIFFADRTHLLLTLPRDIIKSDPN